jgi:hypothetical protein
MSRVEAGAETYVYPPVVISTSLGHDLLSVIFFSKGKQEIRVESGHWNS